MNVELSFNVVVERRKRNHVFYLGSVTDECVAVNGENAVFLNGYREDVFLPRVRLRYGHHASDGGLDETDLRQLVRAEFTL